MSISSVYTTAATDNSASDIMSFTPPNANAVIGDLLIFVIAQPSITNISILGWTGLSGTPILLNFGAQSASASTAIYYYFLQSGDSCVGNTSSVTITLLNGSCYGAMMCYHGVNSSSPINASGTTNTGTGSSVTINSVTTLSNGAWYIGGLAITGSTAQINTLTSGSPTPTMRANNSDTHATVAVGLFDVDLSIAGPSGAFIYSLNGSDTWGSYSFSLTPIAPPIHIPRHAFINHQEPGII